jgi:hypothetical protein
MSWANCAKNGVLWANKKEKDSLHTIRKGKAIWIGHILQENCLLKHTVEGKTERTER